MATTTDPDTLCRHVKLFAQLLTACPFAAALARQQRLGVHPVQGELSSLADVVDTSARAARNEGYPGVFVLTDVSSPEELVEALNAFHAHARFQVQPRANFHGNECCELLWSTPDDEPSSAMGLAPLHTMPVTRRAPVFALVFWPGPKRSGSKLEKVSFADIPLPVDEWSKDETFREATRRTKACLGEWFDTVHWRNTTFSLPSKLRDSFAWIPDD